MAEGGVDTDSLLDKGGNPNVDDDDAEEIELKDMGPPRGSSSRRGSEDVAHTSQTSTSRYSKDKEDLLVKKLNELTPPTRGDSPMTEESYRFEESKMNEAWDKIRKKFPHVDTSDSTFTATLSETGQVDVRLATLGGKTHRLFKADGELRKGLPKAILERLGPPAEEIVEASKEEIAKATTEKRELETKLKLAPENEKEGIRQQIVEKDNEIDRLEGENEAIEQRMSLRYRIKAIFKKYGFTLIGVLTAVGTVIGVIVSNLKQGLTTLGKGVGNALKSIGKKLGEILPGLVGAIASFVFKTAGEVIGFLGKNAWLLIVGVVVFLIERLKKKTR